MARRASSSPTSASRPAERPRTPELPTGSNRRPEVFRMVVALLALAPLALLAANAPRPEDNWPQWRGRCSPAPRLTPNRR